MWEPKFREVSVPWGLWGAGSCPRPGGRGSGMWVGPRVAGLRESAEEGQRGCRGRLVALPGEWGQRPALASPALTQSFCA